MRPGTTLRATLAALGAALLVGSSAVGVSAATSSAAAPVPAEPAAAPLAGHPFAAERDALFAGVNGDRTASGLVRYVRDPGLERLAQDRAERLVAAGAFGHPFAGPPILESVIDSGIDPFGVGEALGWTSRSGAEAFASIRGMWAASPSHKAVVMSQESSYAGVGVVVRSGRTLVVLVTADTADRTPPVVADVGLSRQGGRLVVRWRAADPLLQAHTAGVRDATVEYRVDGGAWRVAQRAATTGAAALPRVRAGSTCEVRVRVRDRAGNLSAWVQTATSPAP